MSEFVKKGALGYKTVQDEKDSECTHVILTLEEYTSFISKLRQAENDVLQIRNQAIAALKEAHAETDRMVKQTQNEAQKQQEQLRKEIEEAKTERDYQINLNHNLLRISKERSNADRKLRPKKEHTGYVVISSQEKEIRFKYGKKLQSVKVWETVIQSPYSVEFSEEQARNQIQRELLTNDGGWKLGEIGITSAYHGSFEEMIETYGTAAYEKNRAYSGRLRANYKAGYWEYVVLHTLALSLVPKNMMP